MATALEELQDLIGFLPEAERPTFQRIIEKPENAKFAQELRDGRLRQSDYSKFMNTNKERLTYADKMQEWAEGTLDTATGKRTGGNVAKHKKLVEDFTELETKSKTLEQQAAEYREQLAKVQSGELNVDEATLNARVDDRLKNAGYVTQSEMQKIVKEEAGKMATEQASLKVKETTDFFLNTIWPQATEINQALIEASFLHMKDFGAPLNKDERKAIADLFVNRHLTDPMEAYNEWAKPKRDAIEFDKKVDAAVNDRLSKQNFPGVTGVPVSEMGPVQQARAGNIPELPAGAELGDGSAAMAAAKEFRTEGKW